MITKDRIYAVLSLQLGKRIDERIYFIGATIYDVAGEDYQVSVEVVDAADKFLREGNVITLSADV